MTTSINTDQLASLGLTRSTPTAAKSDFGQGEFIKLMLAQIQNQDPLKPMQSGEFLTQIAQFGTVNGIKDLQESFAGFVNAMQSNYKLQASALLGRDVVVESDSAILPLNGAISGFVSLPETTGALTVNIYDQGGQLVKKLNMGMRQAGNIPFSWNGQLDDGSYAPEGVYRMKAISTSGGETVQNVILAVSKINSVVLGRNSTDILLNVDGLGSVTLNDIVEIR